MRGCAGERNDPGAVGTANSGRGAGEWKEEEEEEA